MSPDDQEFKYCRNVLKGTLAIITALAWCGLPFKGTIETSVPLHNHRIRLLPCRASSKHRNPKHEILLVFLCLSPIYETHVTQSSEYKCWSSSRHHTFSNKCWFNIWCVSHRPTYFHNYIH
jgi:hypothetical protein